MEMSFKKAIRFKHFLCPSCLRSWSHRRQISVRATSWLPKLLYRPADNWSLRVVHRNSSRDCSSFTKRSHTCGKITLEDIDNTVHLYGWVQYNRMAGSSCQFLIIRDWTGLVQVAVPQSMVTDEIQSLSTESVIEVTGKVQKRPEGQENKKMVTGFIEIIPSEIKVLNRSKPTLPVQLTDHQQSKEDLRLQYRYLDLRQQQLQYNLRLRSKIIMKMREFLYQHGFVDVETPTLFRRTPGGAKEFVVPSHYPGKFYSLPQSPQQFKQLLMVGGLDRYFQIARCYRDESIKMDRQLEFTQVDIELSFTTQEDVRCLVEEMIQHSWPADKGQITPPFPIITYQQAMNDYGVDKPDTRFDLKLVDISEESIGSGYKVFDDVLTKEHGKIVAICLPKAKGVLSNKEIENLRKSPLLHINLKPAVIKVDKGKWESFLSKHLSAEVKEKINKKLGLEDQDIVFVAVGENFTPNEVLGRLRLEAAKILDKKGVLETKLRDPTKHHFLWVIDFPMFLHKEDAGGDGCEIESAHHPFTAPHPEDQHLIYTHPMEVRSQHYDLVLNGNEIGGGSIRIHNSELQRFVIEKILKEDARELEHLLEALSYGAPPHGGIALGLDRLLAIICDATSIRDVIAFPKSAEGKDYMSEAPAEISDKDLELYHIQVKR